MITKIAQVGSLSAPSDVVVASAWTEISGVLVTVSPVIDDAPDVEPIEVATALSMETASAASSAAIETERREPELLEEELLEEELLEEELLD
jgi:hypothetical protein